MSKNTAEPDLKGFEIFLQNEELSPATLSKYVYAVGKYFEVYSELNKQNVVDWKKKLEKTMSASSVNGRLIAIKRYATYKGVLIPVKAVKIQKIFFADNVITDEQYSYLMDCLKSDDMQWYYNMLVLAKTGTRVSEAVRLKKSDAVRGYAIISSKGKMRTIRFPRILKKELANYLKNLDSQDYLLQTNQSQGKYPISRGAVWYELQKFSEQYGIAEEVMHPHSLRHHFGIKVMAKTNDVTLLADLLGHSSINTTAIYTRMSNDQQQKILDDAVDW